MYLVTLVISLVLFFIPAMESINVSTFNCTGIKSSVEYIAQHLCTGNQIIALQETWLLPHDLPLCDSIHPAFCAFATSSVDVGAGVVRGRPHGGLAFLFHRTIEPYVTPVTFGEDRVLGLMFRDEQKSILFLNIYMPTQSNDNFDPYVSLLGRIMAIVHEQDADAVCVVGDFNAKPHTPFFRELERSCSDNGLAVCDVRHLPVSSYTHLNEAHNTTSWLDHVVASENIAHSLNNFKIIYGNSTSNHFPVCFQLTSDLTTINLNNSGTRQNQIKWEFDNENLMQTFYNNLDVEMSNLEYNFCNVNNCNSEICKTSLNIFYEKLCTCITRVGRNVFGTIKNSRARPVPGWNDLVKEHHHLAREAFLAWRIAGSPREGDVALRMRAYRAQFKLALRECRASEDRLRTEAMASKLANHDVKGYWKAVKSLSPMCNKLSNKLDSVVGESEICNLWHNKFKNLFNSVNPNCNHSNLLNMQDQCEFVTVSTVSSLVKKLASGKAVGVDNIPAEIYIHASHRLRTLITIFINACFTHSYMPQIITNTILVPILKNKLKPATESDNYRPIAIATAISKLFELIILSKCEDLLSTTDNQFGFKRSHSTDLCIYSLKEIINYYNSQGSPVFLCYLDIRKAFDRVNHTILFKKLIERSVPIYLVKFIAFWYVNQQIVIRWGNSLSNPFTVKNGIKQGGLLSPYLFNLYVDKLSVNLNACEVGCIVGKAHINHLAYADDMVLIAPSKKALQLLLDICGMYADIHDIIYGTDKSFCMVCWPRHFLFKFFPTFYLQGDILEFVNVYKYLGVMITIG